MSHVVSAVRAVALSAVVLATACAPAAPPPTAPSGGSVPAAPELSDNQKLVIGFSSVPPTMDPHLSTSGAVRKFDMWETLILLDDSGQKVLPLLATEWKLVNETTWRLTLRQDARFHDGSPVTSADVAFSWQRVSAGGIKSPIPGSIPTVSTITAVDPFTVDVITRLPDPLLMKRLYYLAIVPKAYIERVGDTEFAAKPIGSGPFTLKEFRPDDRVTVARWNEHPYRKPKLTEITVRAIPDPTARLQGLRLGELDWVNILPVDSADALRKEGYIVSTSPEAVAGALLDTWGVDGTNVGPIADKRVRQALNYAVDRDAIAKTIYAGVSRPAGLMILDNSFGYDSNIKPYTYDPKKAKELLAQAGYSNGFKITMEFTANSAQTQGSAIYLQSALKEIGIELELAPIDAATFVQKIYKQRPIAPIYLGGLGTTPYMDADLFLTWFWSNNKSFGKRFNNPEFDRVYEASQKEMDPAKRETLLKQANQILQNDPGWLGLVTTTGVAAGPKTIVGASNRADSFPLFDNVYRTK